MKIYKSLMLIGSILILLPFLGVPYAWKQIADGVLGIIVLWMGVSMWREARIRRARRHEHRMEHEGEGKNQHIA